MEDQDPRVSRERIGGRGDEEAIGRDSTSAPPPRGTSTRPRTAIGYPESSAAGRQDDLPDKRMRQIRAEIEHTRGEMSETVDTIQDRLRPSALAASAAEGVKHAASETAQDVAESDSVQYVRANPIPTAMVGIGIAGLVWLAMGGRPSRSHDRRPSGTTRRGWGASAENHSTDLGSGATTDDMRRRAEQTAHRAQDQLRRTWDESPFLIGSAAAVLGAIIGSAAPETERENQLMGETRDSMVESVEHAVTDRVSQVQDAATKAAGLGSSEPRPDQPEA